MDNRIEFKVYGEYALFTDPITRLGGEKCSYHVPTYQALKGILEGIYWKPTFKWIIERVKVIKPIQTQTRAMKPMKYTGGQNDLAIYTYLHKVEYLVSAHFEWNEQRKDLEDDRNENKHYFIAQRMLERGGKRDIFLGTRECVGYVEPCLFNDEKSVYAESGEISYGIMFHGYDYPTETGEEKLYARLSNTVMKDGIINFLRPEECTMRTEVKNMKLIRVETTRSDEVIT